MPLSGFDGTLVDPGDPVTAQAWNEIVEALREVYAELNAQRSLRVTVTNDALDPETVRLTAVHAEFAPVEAVRPTAAGGDHVLSGLRPGAWTLQGSAPGYRLEPRAVEVPAEGELAPVEVALEAVGAFMPAIFGEKLRSALELLAEAGIEVERVYDVTGAAFVADEALAEYADSPVMFHLPAAGASVTPEVRAGIVVGAALAPAPSVEMPDLRGKTLQQARKILEQLGLVLGPPAYRTRLSRFSGDEVIIGRNIDPTVRG